jgi:transposase-like protein
MLAAEEFAVSNRRRVQRVYTPAEKTALVGEVQRRHRAEGLSAGQLARELGISSSSYYCWARAGVRGPEISVTPQSAARQASSTALGAKGARRYDAGQRAALLAEVAARRQAGETLGAILKALDLGRTSYARWLECERPAPSFRAVLVEDVSPDQTPKAGPAALVPIAVADQAIGTPTAPLTLVAPGGYRIEGLAVESAAALLRALA